MRLTGYHKAFTMILLTIVPFAKVSPPLGSPPAGFKPPLAPSGNVKVGHKGPPTHPKNNHGEISQISRPGPAHTRLVVALRGMAK